MGESSQATARLRGFWRRGEEGGALNAVHGAGKNAASFHCNQTSGVDWGGGERNQLLRLRILFLPANVENTHVDVRFKLYSWRVLLYFSACTA